MDPALLRERESFKKKAFSIPTVETKKRKEDTEEKKRPEKPGPSQQPFRHVVSAGSGAASNYKFGILTKIVKHLRQKFKDGEDFPLTLEEVLDETSQLDASSKVRAWLLTEALPNNPKIETTPEGRLLFKPPLKCRDKRSLLRLLKTYDMRGYGGIARDDVVESVPHAEKVLKSLDSEIITIVRQDKKKILFYNDRSTKFEVDDEFQKLWRSVAVDGIDDQKIEDYLDKAGIKSMEGQGVKKVAARQKKTAKRKPIRKLKDNEHLVDVLKNYDA